MAMCRGFCASLFLYDVFGVLFLVYMLCFSGGALLSFSGVFGGRVKVGVG